MSHPNQRPRRRASQSSGYYTQSSYGRSSVGGAGTGTYATESYAGGTYFTDPSYGDAYGDEYGDMYGEDDASNYSSGSMARTQGYYATGTDPRTMVTEESSISSRFGANRAHNSIATRGDDVMSQQSFRLPSSQSVLLRESEISSNIQSDNYSIAGTSVGATTVADGGRGRCPYQIEFSVSNTGKQMSTSKRIIHFRFGFANSRALVQGKVGVDCRGVEHDVIITWSITGGKRSISVDGREIHFEAGKRGQSATNPSRRADILEAAWQMPEEHVCQLMCYAYKPAIGSPEKRNKKWRQYNLTIDGRSFFELPQIFDLGLKGLVTVKAADPLPPMMIEAKDSFGTMSSDLIPPNQNKPRDERRLKNEIQHRIQVQRNLLESRKKNIDVNRDRQARCGDAASVASLNEARQRQAQEQQHGLQSAPGSQFFSQTSQRPAPLPASQGYSVLQQQPLMRANQSQAWLQHQHQQQQQPLMSRQVGIMYQNPPQPGNASTTVSHQGHITQHMLVPTKNPMSQSRGTSTMASQQGQVGQQQQHNNNPNVLVPRQQPLYESSGLSNVTPIQGQVRQEYQQQQPNNQSNVVDMGPNTMFHQTQVGQEQERGAPVTCQMQHTSQLERAPPQTSHNPPQVNNISNSYVGSQPPTMDDIRDSMNSSKNRFGFY
ncbi:hypothetical protein ACHAW6_003938 [Cyclotella cf. meneghiniana]